MFSSFVYFQEVSKLSPNCLIQLNRINFSENVIKFLKDDHCIIGFAEAIIENDIHLENEMILRNCCDLATISPNLIEIISRSSFKDILVKYFKFTKTHVNVINYLSKYSSNIQNCPIDEAIENSRIEIIKYLIYHGNENYQSNKQLLSLAFRLKQWKLIEYLILVDKELFIDTEDIDMFIVAIKCYKGKIASWLIRNGINMEKLKDNPEMRIYYNIFACN